MGNTFGTTSTSMQSQPNGFDENKVLLTLAAESDNEFVIDVLQDTKTKLMLALGEEVAKEREAHEAEIEAATKAHAALQQLNANYMAQQSQLGLNTQTQQNPWLNGQMQNALNAQQQQLAQNSYYDYLANQPYPDLYKPYNSLPSQQDQGLSKGGLFGSITKYFK